MRAATRPEAVREAQEVDLVDLVEHRHHGLLDDLVLQGRDAQRSHPPVGLRDEDTPGRQRPIGSRVDPPVQVHETIFEVGFVPLPRHPVDTRSRPALEREETLEQQRDGDVVQ